MGDQPRYQTLRDYLRVIRAQRWLILLFVLAFGAAAFAYSARQDEQYEAEASVAYKEPTEALDLVGGSTFPRQAPDTRAAINAELITRSEVARRVREALGLNVSVEALQGAVNARAEARTNLVVLQARAGSAEFAARLANEFARQGIAVANEEQRDRVADAEASVRRSLRDAERSARRRDVPLSDFTRAAFIDRITRLQALTDFGESAEVTKLAEVPSTPVSPKPVRNTVLGVILGLTLGLLAAFIRDSLDVRLRGAREIQAQVKLPLLGHVGSEAMGSAGAASQNGHRSLSPADLESFRILRKNLEFLDVDRPLRTIAVTSGLPEEGKSTVAAALAAAYAQAGRNTLLLECDLRRPALAKRLGLEAAPGLTDYLGEHASPPQVLQSVTLGSSEAGGSGNGATGAAGVSKLVCITAGQAVPRPADVLGSQRFRDLLAQLRDAYDVVVLDTSPLLSVADTLEVLPQVDGVILCVRAGRTSREEAKAAKSALDHLPERPTGLVVTGIKPGDETDYGYYSSSHAYGVNAES